MDTSSPVDAARDPERTEPALSLEGVRSGYGDTVVLRDVSLVVPVGAVVALLGPNGAGKSTLVRTVSGHLTAQRGAIRMFGRDVTTLAPHKRARLGLCHVPEGRGVFRSLTVRENIVMQSSRGSENEAAEKATTAFPVLATRMHQTAGTLSGGEQQMLALAASYVRNPNLILVDEPSLGLAPLVIDQVFEFLSLLRRSGTALLVIDQFVERTLEIADRAYVLRRGEIAYDGSTEQLRDSNIFDEYLGSGH
jgi:branched-chain amino acid transport system ATP-binding protein